VGKAWASRQAARSGELLFLLARKYVCVCVGGCLLLVPRPELTLGYYGYCLVIL
jgi:hypothetical protein